MIFATEPIQIRGTDWRFAIDPATGRGAYQWRRDCSSWMPLTCYPHKLLGPITLAELDAAIYQPMHITIRTARGNLARAAATH